MKQLESLDLAFFRARTNFIMFDCDTNEYDGRTVWLKGPQPLKNIRNYDLGEGFMELYYAET